MKFRKYILLCLMLWMAFASRADHAAGGYFEYTCLGNNQYQVDFFFLRDCSGIDFPPNVYFFTSNSCGAACESILVPSYYHTTIDFGCGNNCLENGPTLEGAPSFELVQYRAVLTLPTACADWTVAVSIHARNETTYSPTFGTYYNYCIINNTNDICSSSVRLDGIPVTLGCLNDGGKSMYSIVNTNGGTLEYELVDPLIGMCGGGIYPVPHEGPTSVNRPVPSTTDWNISPSGELSYTPNAIGTGYFALKITERNASNTVVGVTVIDGMVFTSPDCEQGSTIDFFDWTSSGGNTITTSSVTEPLCGTFHMVANDDDESITNVIVEAPHFVDYSITYNNDGTVTVDVCADFPDELLCQEIQASITVTGITSDAGCTAIASNAGHKGYYYLVKEKGLYCPDNLFFTNRNAQSGIPMPLYAHAEERIWVGDNMPSIAPPQTEGPVTVGNGTILKAGAEIILPSCDVGTACVTLNGNVDLIIAPNSCSSECPSEPLSLSVREEFNCHSETLMAEVEGDGPFTYQWIMAGDTVISSSPYFNIHTIVSEYDGGQMPYTCNVFDAIGNSGTFSGQVLGTKNLYRDIRDNTIYFDYDDDHMLEDGYYYAGNPYIGTTTFEQNGQTYWLEDNPFYVYDAINDNGPWYGASYMKLVVWDRWGQIVHYIERDLEGGTDWSFNQGEMYWNGYWWNGNGQTSSCVYPESQMVTYELWARNCLTPVHYEVSGIPIFSCYEQPWVPEETKSTLEVDDEVWVEHDDSRFVDLGDRTSLNEDIICYPNPAAENVFVRADATLLRIIVTDLNGKTIVSLDPNATMAEIDITGLSNGVYTIQVTTELGENRIKLIKH